MDTERPPTWHEHQAFLLGYKEGVTASRMQVAKLLDFAAGPEPTLADGSSVVALTMLKGRLETLESKVENARLRCVGGICASPHRSAEGS